MQTTANPLPTLVRGIAPASWLRAAGVGLMASVLVVPSICAEYAENATYAWAAGALFTAVLWARALQSNQRAWRGVLPLSGVLVALFAATSQSVDQNAASLGVSSAGAELVGWLPKLLLLCMLFAVPERYFAKLAHARGGPLARDDAWRTAIYSAYALVPLVVLGASFFDETSLEAVLMFVALSVGVCLHALQYVRVRAMEAVRTMFLTRVARGEEPRFRIVETHDRSRLLVRVAAPAADATAYRTMEAIEEEVAALNQAGMLVPRRCVKASGAP